MVRRRQRCRGESITPENPKPKARENKAHCTSVPVPMNPIITGKLILTIGKTIPVKIPVT